MSELKLQIDASTGLATELELNQQELALLKTDRTLFENNQKSEQDRLSARDSALAKLAALGLTEEEIAAL